VLSWTPSSLFLQWQVTISQEGGCKRLSWRMVWLLRLAHFSREPPGSGGLCIYTENMLTIRLGRCHQECLIWNYRKYFIYQCKSPKLFRHVLSYFLTCQPFILARTYSSLDHATKGRIAWNIVTSYSDASAKANGLEEITAHDLRYEKAHEYMDLVYS
jgi:hypothetical protein